MSNEENVAEELRLACEEHDLHSTNLYVTSRNRWECMVVDSAGRKLAKLVKRSDKKFRIFIKSGYLSESSLRGAMRVIANLHFPLE